MGTSTDGNKFTIDTKGSCFLCLQCDLTEGAIPYTFQRLAKYLKLDFKNVYNISFPMASSISALENSEVVVSICTNCSIEANKFIKLHKDLELIRKRTNTCVGRICNLMVEADRNPKRLQEYRQRMTATANPLELIQASIADNLRKETIDKCSQVTVLSTGSVQIQPTTSVSIPALTPITPSLPPNVSTRSELEISRVSSTTKTTFPVASSQEKEVVLVDLDDSDEEDSEKVPIIKSVTGAGGAVFSSHSNTTHHNDQSLSFQQFGNSSTRTGFTTQDPGSSFSALQNFTSDYNFNASQSQVVLSAGPNSDPAVPISSDSPQETLIDESEWHVYSDGRYQCKICGKILKKYEKTIMTVHMRMHAGVKPIPCEHCNQQFRSTGNRRIHVLTYHRKELFAQFHYPAVPKVTFQNVIDTVFKNVQRTSDTDRPHRCTYCAKQCRHRIDVEAHMISLHFNEIGSKLMEMQRQGVGGDASYSSIHADDPQQVLPTTIGNTGERGSKNISCETCGIKFRYASSLTKHVSNNGCTGNKTGTQGQAQNTNTPPKNSTFIVKWKCGICSSTFGSQVDLKKHKSVKHGNNSKGGSSTEAVATVYKCTYCVKKFRFYHSQRVHMLTLHRYQVFSKYVPEGTTANTLERAIQNILENCKTSDGSNHVCKFCNRDFAGSVESILQNHILVNHFQEVVNRLKNAVEEASQVESVIIVDQDMSVKEEVEAVLPD